MTQDEIKKVEDAGGFRKLSLAYETAISGNTAKIETKEALDILVEKLQEAGNHKGIVIAFCNPWLVSVVKD